MGKIASASTVYARAYLTELGRKYLFNSTKYPRYVTLQDGTVVDNLEISRFSLGDPDVNYNLSNRLVSGDIPDVSGESEYCITGAKGRRLNNLIAPNEAAFSIGDTPEEPNPTVTYGSSLQSVNFDLSLGDNAISPVVSQQLLFYIDGLLQNNPDTHGIFTMSLANNGSIKPENDGVYRIVMKEPALQVVGYRLVIFPPTAGQNWDISTIQIESGTKVATTTTVGISPSTSSVSVGQVVITNASRASQTGFAAQSGNASSGVGAQYIPFNPSTSPTSPTYITTWTALDSFANKTGLRDAIKDFINTQENGVKLQSNLTLGRKKEFSFNFKHDPSPVSTEIGVFKIVLSYPANSNINPNVSENVGTNNIGS